MLSAGRAAFAVEQTMLSDGSVHVIVTGAVHAVSSCEFMDVLIGGITPGRTLIVDLASATHIGGTGQLRVVGCTGETGHLWTTIKTGLG